VSNQPKLLISLSEAAELLGLKPSNLYETHPLSQSGPSIRAQRGGAE
jgi:hypothetical protein